MSLDIETSAYTSDMHGEHGIAIASRMPAAATATASVERELAQWFQQMR